MIAHAGLPAGLSAHLAGAVATQVDQQKASGNQGGKVQDFSALLIIVLLLLIFRSLTLSLTRPGTPQRPRCAQPARRRPLPWLAEQLKPAIRLAEHWAHGLDSTGPLDITCPDTARR